MVRTNRIPANGLKPGMSTHKLECVWLEYPFVGNSFRTKTNDDAFELAGVKHHKVWVDANKSLFAPVVAV